MEAGLENGDEKKSLGLVPTAIPSEPETELFEKESVEGAFGAPKNAKPLSEEVTFSAASLKHPDSQTSQQPSYQEQPRKEKNRLHPLVIILIIALVVVAGALLYYILKDLNRSQEPSATVASNSDVTVPPTETEPLTQEQTVPPTNNPSETFFEGIWQGNDSNVTIIEIYSDHTLYYRELYNRRYATVAGMKGTWELEGADSIKISVPGLGNGYKLKGTRTVDGGIFLQCTNNQPWSDETIWRSDFTQEEIEEIVEKQLEKKLPDGLYYIDWTQSSWVWPSTAKDMKYHKMFAWLTVICFVVTIITGYEHK